MTHELIVTVGSSPLPVVVSILHFQPSHVYLVYTPDVSKVVERVCDHLQRNLLGCARTRIEIKEYCKAEEIRRQLQAQIPQNVWAQSGLNYTGGTKLMSVHAHALWTEKDVNKENASYLAANGKLYFDDPSIDPVPEKELPGLSLEELCKLHFGDKRYEPGDDHTIQKRQELARKVHKFVCDRGFKAYQELLPPIHTEDNIAQLIEYNVELKEYKLINVKCDWNAAKTWNFKTGKAFNDFDLSGVFTLLNIRATDIESFCGWFDENYSNKNSEKKKMKSRLECVGWLWAKWLEVWLANELINAMMDDGQPIFDEVHQNVNVGTQPDNFELDVVAVRGYRVFVFSCTTDSRNHVKSKLFEAASRASRIGGEHARAAVVSLHEKPFEVLQTVREEHWPGYNTLRLFGAPHVKGLKESCNVEPGTERSPQVTLLEGIREWIST